MVACSTRHVAFRGSGRATLVPLKTRVLEDTSDPVRKHAVDAILWLAKSDATVLGDLVDLVEQLNKTEDAAIRLHVAAGLKTHTGQDFGIEAGPWRTWLDANPPATVNP